MSPGLPVAIALIGRLFRIQLGTSQRALEIVR
jgi:hypothetical protein